MGEKKQRLKGKANLAAGRTKARVGFETGNKSTEAKGAAQTVKGKAQEKTGKLRKKLS